MPAVIDRLALAYESSTAELAKGFDVRVLITAGVLVDFVAVYVTLSADGDVDISTSRSNARCWTTLTDSYNPRNVDLKVATPILQLARRVLVAAAGGTDPAKPIPPSPLKSE